MGFLDNLQKSVHLTRFQAQDWQEAYGTKVTAGTASKEEIARCEKAVKRLGWSSLDSYIAERRQIAEGWARHNRFNALMAAEPGPDLAPLPGEGSDQYRDRMLKSKELSYERVKELQHEAARPVLDDSAPKLPVATAEADRPALSSYDGPEL